MGWTLTQERRRRAPRSLPRHHWGLRGASMSRNVQAMRGVAAFIVFLIHVASTKADMSPDYGLEWFHQVWLRVGPAGVDIFFVISGFVVTMAAYRATKHGSRGAIEFGLSRRRKRTRGIATVAQRAILGHPQADESHDCDDHDNRSPEAHCSSPFFSRFGSRNASIWLVR